MRFFVFVISIAVACGFSAAQAAVAAKPGTVVEDPVGALAPDDGRLDSLFDKLRKERNPESASAIAEQIRETFAISGSATIDMLMASATKAASEKRFGAALDFLDQVTLLAPDFAEGWNRRATVHYMMGNLPKAMSDTARVLTLEPRHIGALGGLAGILQETGRDRQALEAWESYLRYYPADRDAQKQTIELINKLSDQKT